MLIDLTTIEQVAKQYLPDESIRKNFLNALERMQGAGTNLPSNMNGRPMTEEESHKALQPITEGIISDIPLSIYLMPERPNAKLPMYKTKDAAAMDIFAAESISILPGAIGVVSTGVKMAVPVGFKGEVYSRSGMAANGIFVANQPGKIDADYRGEIKVILYNSTSDTVTIGVNERIAQFEINPVFRINPVLVDKLSTTERGTGGLGSTGK